MNSFRRWRLIASVSVLLALAINLVPVAAQLQPARPGPLNQAIDQLVRSEDGVYGIVLMQPDGEITFSRNGDTPFVAASLYKLVLMANIYEKAEVGELELLQVVTILPAHFAEIEGSSYDSYFDQEDLWIDFTVDELLHATGAYSSNVAAWALLTLTDPQSLSATALKLGMVNTHLFADPFSMAVWPPAPGPDSSVAELLIAAGFVEANIWYGTVMITTPRDVATFFQGLLAGTAGYLASQAMLAILDAQQVNDRIPALLPTGARTAHKTGNLERVVHDAGIIWTPHGPMILAALVEDCPDEQKATTVIQRVAQLTYWNGAPPMPDPGVLHPRAKSPGIAV